MDRAKSLSARYGEMNEVMASADESANSLETCSYCVREEKEEEERGGTSHSPRRCGECSRFDPPH